MTPAVDRLLNAALLANRTGDLSTAVLYLAAASAAATAAGDAGLASAIRAMATKWGAR